MRENIYQDKRYVGNFEIDGSDLPGTILYNRGNGVIMLDLRQEVSGFGKAFGKTRYIKGKLDTGVPVILYNNRCVTNQTQSFQFQHLSFIAEHLVFGKAGSESCNFNKMVCVIENGLGWSGLSQIAEGMNTTISIKGLDNEPIFNWFGATIKFSTKLENGLWRYPRSEKCVIKERLLMEIECEDKREISFFLKVRDSVLSMISFAISDNVNIEEQYLCDCDDTYNVGPISELNQYPIITNEPYWSILGTHYYDRNFYLEELPQSDDISAKLEKLIPVFNLYQSLIRYNDMPLEMRFLNIVQAIETFHARFFYNDKKKKYVKSVYERFESSPHFEYIKNLLLSDTQMDKNCNYIILVSRLNDLFIGEYDGLFCDYYDRGTNYAQTIADTRHYYTHYSESKAGKALTGDALSEAVEIVRMLLEHNVCLVLGIDSRERTSQRLGSYHSYKQLDYYD